MKIVWTRYAVEDREEILEYTAARNPTAALEQDLRTEEAVGLLGDHPRAGRAGRVDGTRELVVTGTPFVVVYLPRAEEIRVLRILHGAREWPRTEV